MIKVGNNAIVSSATVGSNTVKDIYLGSELVYTEPISKTFTYTGAKQTITLKKGKYKLQCWGAQGGSYNSSYPGGKGGYAEGVISITATSATCYVYVGGSGATNTSTTTTTYNGGFNGGGSGHTYSNRTHLPGGGASDVRIGEDSLYARVIVAGGGGGAGSNASGSTTSYRYKGGYGGGSSGGSGNQRNTSNLAGSGGTQTVGGTSNYGTTSNSTNYGNLADFGKGGGYKSGNYAIAGGGGGWYGGGYSKYAGAGGGSGFVFTGGTPVSGYKLGATYALTSTKLQAGNISTIPTTGGTSTETGHAGNGCVKITTVY